MKKNLVTLKLSETQLAAGENQQMVAAQHRPGASDSWFRTHQDTHQLAGKLRHNGEQSADRQDLQRS